MTDRDSSDIDLLNNRPQRGEGVRRLNKVPLLIAGIMLMLIIGAVTYTYQTRIAEMRRKAASTTTRPEPADISALFDDVPNGGLIPARVPDLVSPVSSPQEKAEEPPEPSSFAPDPYADEWERYVRDQRKLIAYRLQRMRQAIISSVEVKGVVRRPAQLGGQRSAAPPQSRSINDRLAEFYATNAKRQAFLANGFNGYEQADINRAEQKRTFLGDREPGGASDNYLSSRPEKARSPYELKAGTVIPAILVGGVNSDLPGQIIGQVRENVYDSATGRHILIPQGAKLIGTYDNSVTQGQERVLVAWTRIIFPDSSSLDLGKMPGADQSGYAGFNDRVNTHFWKAFGHALMLSVFSAGVQISQGGSSGGDNGLNVQQTIAAGLGQQLGQLGQEIARQNIRIQPTLEIRPGYRFTIMVTKDIVFR